MRETDVYLLRVTSPTLKTVAGDSAMSKLRFLGSLLKSLNAPTFRLQKTCWHTFKFKVLLNIH